MVFGREGGTRWRSCRPRETPSSDRAFDIQGRSGTHIHCLGLVVWTVSGATVSRSLSVWGHFTFKIWWNTISTWAVARVRWDSAIKFIEQILAFKSLYILPLFFSLSLSSASLPVSSWDENKKNNGKKRRNAKENFVNIGISNKLPSNKTRSVCWNNYRRNRRKYYNCCLSAELCVCVNMCVSVCKCVRMCVVRPKAAKCHLFRQECCSLSDFINTSIPSWSQSLFIFLSFVQHFVREKFPLVFSDCFVFFCQFSRLFPLAQTFCSISQPFALPAGFCRMLKIC